MQDPKVDSEPHRETGTAQSMTISAHGDRRLPGQVIWDLITISHNLAEIRRSFAKQFGISGPQWLILMAIDALDRGDGVPVVEVSQKIHAVATFVTTQTKILERLGLVDRVTSKVDARVVLMSLSQIARSRMTDARPHQDALHEFIFQDFDAGTLGDIHARLGTLNDRMRQAVRRFGEITEDR